MKKLALILFLLLFAISPNSLSAQSEPSCTILVEYLPQKSNPSAREYVYSARVVFSSPQLEAAILSPDNSFWELDFGQTATTSPSPVEVKYRVYLGQNGEIFYNPNWQVWLDAITICTAPFDTSVLPLVTAAATWVPQPTSANTPRPTRVPQPTSASGEPGNDCQPGTPCFLKQVNPLYIAGDGKIPIFANPATILNRLSIFFLFPFAGLILFVMIVWGGFEMLSGASNAKSQEAGKQRITAAIIGFILLFVSYWLAQIVQFVFGVTILG